MAVQIGEGGVGTEHNPASARDEILAGHRSKHNLRARTAEKIDGRHGLNFLESRSEQTQDAFPLRRGRNSVVRSA